MKTITPFYKRLIIKGFCFIVLIAVSCVQELDVDRLPESRQQLVLMGLFSQKDTFAVQLTKSYPITYDSHELDYKELIYVKNGTIELYENGILIDTLKHQKEGYYQAPGFIPSAGKTYAVRASAPGFEETIHAKSSIPEPVKIHKLDTSQSNTILYFNDPQNEKNYYWSFIKRFDYLEYYGPNHPDNWLWIGDHADNDYRYAPAAAQSNLRLILEDSELNHQTGTFEMELTLKARARMGYSILIIYLANLSEDLYKYLYTLNQQVKTTGTILPEPVILYDNVENGIGIFGGYGAAVDTLIFDERED